MAARGDCKMDFDIDCSDRLRGGGGMAQ